MPTVIWGPTGQPAVVISEKAEKVDEYEALVLAAFGYVARIMAKQEADEAGGLDAWRQTWVNAAAQLVGREALERRFPHVDFTDASQRPGPRAVGDEAPE